MKDDQSSSSSRRRTNKKSRARKELIESNRDIESSQNQGVDVMKIVDQEFVGSQLDLNK